LIKFTNYPIIVNINKEHFYKVTKKYLL